MSTQITIVPNMINLATCRRPGRSNDKGYEIYDVEWKRGVLNISDFDAKVHSLNPKVYDIQLYIKIILI